MIEKIARYILISLCLLLLSTSLIHAEKKESDVIFKYYDYLNGCAMMNSIEAAYEISPQIVSYKKFREWYKDACWNQIINMRKNSDGTYSFIVFMDFPDSTDAFNVTMKINKVRILESRAHRQKEDFENARISYSNSKDLVVVTNMQTSSNDYYLEIISSGRRKKLFSKKITEARNSTPLNPKIEDNCLIFNDVGHYKGMYCYITWCYNFDTGKLEVKKYLDGANYGG